MSTKTQPNPLPGNRQPPSETQLTWEQIFQIEQVIKIDLEHVKRLGLTEIVTRHESLLATLALMRVEAYRREHL